MIKIYFTASGETITLPVNPKALPISRSGNNHKDEIVKLGKINILRNPELAQIEIEGFFPGAPGASWIIPGEFHDPDYYISFFESAWFAKKTLEISFSDMSYKLSAAKPRVSIEGFSYNREGGDKDVYYKLSLMEYKPFSSGALDASALVVGGRQMIVTEPGREDNRSVPATYTCVVPPDTLCNIALAFYGDDSKYKDIASLNAIANPNVITNGQVLRLP